MPKIEVNKVAEILKNHIDPAVLRRCVEEMNLAVQPDSVDGDAGDKEPAVKKQFVILVSDPSGVLKKKDFTGWVIQIPQDESPLSALERIQKSAHEFNASKKGRLYPVKTMGDALENVPGKYFREVMLHVKTKEPVLVVVTNNELDRT